MSKFTLAAVCQGTYDMRSMRRAWSFPIERVAIAILIVTAPFLLTGCSPWIIRSASARDGIADLSTGYDFESGELTRLDGEWRFVGGSLIPPEELHDRAHIAAAVVEVPSIWAEVNGFERADPPPTGVATLWLRLDVPRGARDWAMRIPNAYSALRVYVNGRDIAEIGRASGSLDEYAPSNGIAYPEFHTDGGPIDIVLHVANYSTPAIGTWDCPLLGEASSIRSKRLFDVVTTALISGALLIMGLYHLGLFVLRKKDHASLLFGVICLLMAIRGLMMGERLLFELLPPGTSSWEWGFRLQLMSAHMTLPLFALFFLRLFPKQLNTVAVRAIVGVGLAWLALSLSTPAMLYHRFLHWYEYFILIAGAYILIAILVAVIRRERGAVVVSIGIGILLATSTNDVLLSVGYVSNTFYMASYGVFMYIFIQSFQLSMIFSKSFSDVEALSEGLIEKNRELESLHTIDLAIASSMELNKVLDVILEQSTSHLGADAADILLLDSSNELLSLGARRGFRTDALLHTKLRRGEGFAGKALQSGETVIVDDLENHAEGFSRSPAFAAEGFAFYAGRALTVKGKIEGVLEVYRRTPLRPQQSWELYFKTIAGQAAIALDNSALLQGLRKANEELMEANEATIEGWAEALELRDRETHGHSRRVTTMALEMAEAYGIEGDELDRVRRGALLHDIGKMGIPDTILLKPGPLNDEEFDIMKRHPTIARDLLSRLRFLRDAIDIPYAHHEKWDGTGYPRSLRETAIPLSARLFAIVDVWDALSSDRPYRSAWPEARVLEHIESLAGTHFDPDAVRRFLALRSGSKV